MDEFRTRKCHVSIEASVSTGIPCPGTRVPREGGRPQLRACPEKVGERMKESPQELSKSLPLFRPKGRVVSKKC